MLRIDATDGIELSAVEWTSHLPAAGASMLAVHATGFCKETWIPMVFELRRLQWTGRGLGLDQRAHGDSGAPSPPFDWWQLGRDVLTAASELEVPVVAVGHSSGATAIVLAELVEPGSFDRVVLVEPILFPGPNARVDDHPFAEAARKRRRWFPSREAAMENYRGKGAFTGWEERALRAYVRNALRSASDGYELKCDPDLEAEFYASAATHSAWERLPEIRCPVTIVVGSESDTHLPDLVAQQLARFADVELEVVEGVGHFVPMEAPGRLAAIVAERLNAAPVGN